MIAMRRRHLGIVVVMLASPLTGSVPSFRAPAILDTPIGRFLALHSAAAGRHLLQAICIIIIIIIIITKRAVLGCAPSEDDARK